MSLRSLELREIVWSEAFPFVRLFRSFHLAKRPTRVFVALVAILAVYLSARALDGLWVAVGGGVTRVAADRGAMNELDFAVMGQSFTPPASAPGQSRPPQTGPFAAWYRAAERGSNQIIGAAAGVPLGGSLAPVLAGVSQKLSATAWLASHRPIYSLILGLISLAAFSLACLTIARQAALEATIDEHISIGQALDFAKEKWPQGILAMLFFALPFVAAGLVFFLLSLLGAIPYFGELILGFAFPLMLVIGFVLALAVIAGLLGGGLVWPTLAIEASDHFDAVSRACSYVGRKTWSVAFYLVALLVYSGICLAFVRVAAMLTLKLAHGGIAGSLRLIGMHDGGEARLTKLDHMWRMPDWASLPWIPGASDAPFYGDLLVGPLARWETIGAYLLCASVFLIVGIVAAFGVSLWTCGGVQMYLLLRRDVDRTDYDEIFFEEPRTQPTGPLDKMGVSPAAGSTSGTSLPVVRG